MAISGLVVHANAEKLDAVRSELLAMEGVEIHTETEDGRLVVTVDRPTDKDASETLMAMQGIQGVLDASLVYNYFDHDVAEEEEEAQ